jgi:hypothetical protein
VDKEDDIVVEKVEVAKDVVAEKEEKKKRTRNEKI